MSTRPKLTTLHAGKQILPANGGRALDFTAEVGGGAVTTVDTAGGAGAFTMASSWGGRTGPCGLLGGV